MTPVHRAPIDTLLIANRGEIARRIIRTCRRLGVSTVAVYSDADADAPYVHEADVAVRLPGTASADTYLRIDLLIAAAERTGAQAIHPGYGFLSERPDAAEAVTRAGLTWIGPPASAIAAMGSKIGAKQLMRTAGVPVLPDNTVETIDEVGLPALVKASAGGGGRGMRIVRDAAELDDAIASINNMAANNKLSQGIALALAQFDTSLDKLQSARSQTGDWLNRADSITNAQGAQTILLEGDRSRAQDLDMVKGISDFNQKQTGYQAALQSYAQIQKLSLFNFIN